MVRYGFHYLTDTPQKIIDAYKRREKKIIEDLKFGEKIRKMLGSDAENLPSATSLSFSNMETVVVYRHDSILSVYAFWECQRKEPWIGFDLNNKYKSMQKSKIMVIQMEEDFEIGFWKDCETCLTSNGQHIDALISLMKESYMESVNERSLCKALLPLDVENVEELSKILGFPLLLPDDWQEKWKITQISEHIFLAEDKA